MCRPAQIYKQINHINYNRYRQLHASTLAPGLFDIFVMEVMLTLKQVQRHEALLVSQTSSLHRLDLCGQSDQALMYKQLQALHGSCSQQWLSLYCLMSLAALALTCTSTHLMSLCTTLMCFCVTCAKHKKAQDRLVQQAFSNSTATAWHIVICPWQLTCAV